jgi:sulfide:quinone oxidoreductase
MEPEDHRQGADGQPADHGRRRGSHRRPGRLPAIICNRPDGEGADQPTFAEIEKAAKKAGLEIRLPAGHRRQGQDADAEKFGEAFLSCPAGPRLLPHRHPLGHPLVADQGAGTPLPDILAATRQAGYDMGAWCAASPMAARRRPIAPTPHDIVIIGAGAGRHLRRLQPAVPQ